MVSLIIGGCGFIGTNLAAYLCKKDEEVIVLDNFSRYGTKFNAEFLKKNFSDNLEIVKADIRSDIEKLEELMKNVDKVYHFAAQVAVTTSVQNPRRDFEDNALGTFNVLEALRKSDSDASLIFSSTNKVYGGMEEIEIIEKDNRYAYKDFPEGISEQALLDFHSPYGCSKGAADQYVRDYYRIYGINSVVFRQSCIFGEHQMGVEDQGWLAWFTIAALTGKPLTIYGDGKQVRDVLYVQDLIDAFELAIAKINITKGRIYNIGGGPKNAISLLESLDLLEKILGKKIEFKFSDWRPGDQKIYVSNISKAKKEFGWTPKTSIEEGLNKMVNWIKNNKKIFN